MLVDPKTKSSLVNNFAFQWLNVRGLDGIDPTDSSFPRLMRTPGALPQRDGTVRRKHRERGPERHGISDGQPPS
jgi:hypothetical protein